MTQKKRGPFGPPPVRYLLSTIAAAIASRMDLWQSKHRTHLSTLIGSKYALSESNGILQSWHSIIVITLLPFVLHGRGQG